MSKRLLVIEPDFIERHYVRDLWAYRELFLILSWRDIAVRYKQTLIGVAWAVLKPFLTMVVFTVVFGRIAQLPDTPQTRGMLAKVKHLVRVVEGDSR